MKFRRRFSKLKVYTYFWIISITLLILYNEYFSYYFNSFKWFNLKCEDSKKCTRILLVADPQIIGNTAENLHFLTPISIYDSDRYLTKTYSLAYEYIQPDLVIFLGDLMDEAHIASKQDFYQYVRRIFSIFLSQNSESKHVRHIWLPGDNDIGGEDTSVTSDKIKRFQHAFSQPDFIDFNNITFFKINRLTMEVPAYKKKREFYDTTQVFVGLSHVPLMFKPSTFVDKVISKMLPHMLFTAHEHKSMIISTDALLRHDFQIVPVNPDNNQVFEYSLGVSDMYEVLIPTCSYRMGTDKIGYGYAIIENAELRFTVLWSPSRFIQLITYGYVSLIFFVTFIIILLYRRK